MNTFKLRQSLLLLLTAIVWGCAFVAQKTGSGTISPYAFVFSRFIIATIVMTPIAIWSYHGKFTDDLKTLILGGVGCGLTLGIASMLQQAGIAYTSVGNSGFVTATYIMWVPIINIFFGKRPSLLLWLSVAIALVGLYLLCMTEDSFHVQIGDLLTLGCAIIFSLQIIIIDHFSPRVNPIMLSTIQFAVCTVISFIPMALTRTIPTAAEYKDALLPILYAGLISSCVGYTLQIIAQKGMNPAVASLIMSLESTMSVIAAFIILHEVPTTRQLFGCVVMFAAIILAQVPDFIKKEEQLEQN